MLVVGGVVLIFSMATHITQVSASQLINEPIQACVIARDVDLTNAIRAKFAQCLGWQSDQSSPLCSGAYQPVVVAPLANTEEVRIMADRVSFYSDKRSSLMGHVEVQQTQRIVNAQTAYVYRDVKTNKVTRIVFLGDVNYLEPDKLMIARKATINPQDKSGEAIDVLYRFNTAKSKAILPAWGRAAVIRRFANKDYLLRQATYSTCAPEDKAWSIEAASIALDNAKSVGVAKNATIRIREWPVLYTPYLSFPTNKDRKSGFLLPMIGYSNVGGFDFGLPYYWNIAPNYDLTIYPHAYAERGVMMGGEFRYLTPNSFGVIRGDFLPDDKAFKHFLLSNEAEFPKLQGNSSERWSFSALETTRLAQNLQFNLNVQQVSDDYYFQDFSSNLALITQRQLLRQADLVYSTEHWIFRGMGQSYKTLQPVNEPPITPVYERLPQLMARGSYYDLPFDANLNILGQYDQFHWPTDSGGSLIIPQGPRFHFNPILSVPITKTWGYINPSIQFVENYYEVQSNQGTPNANYNRTIPRYSLDSGLYFDRDGSAYTQTIEPRLFYLRVPYQNQTVLPVYDSGYMIFNMDQLFRTNRFSGFDRIGDANQLAYAVTSRWLSSQSGMEKINLSLGQIRYFSNREVQLCQNNIGYCIDNPLTMGYLSPTYKTSPIASRVAYHFNPRWGFIGDYIWNPATKATNNGDLNIRYQSAPNAVITLGYSYLVNADITQVRDNATQNNDLHQGIFAYAWPMTEKWSTVGAYSQNISKNYSMMSLLGVQYDSCCWTMRVLGGRTFQNLNQRFEPQYNNNIYVQIVLKGLGTVANSDPSSILSTYIPNYIDPFRH